MRVYYAGRFTNRMHPAGLRRPLVSYADAGSVSFDFWMGQADADVFLDSGAFAVHVKGAEIDLSEYCDFIDAHRQALTCYAALDVIGDPVATRRNLKAMRDRGLDPVPTFHRGSPLSELDRLLDGSSYVAIGGLMASAGRREFARRDRLEPYLDRCFEVLGRHWPVKVHLFGVTAQWVLERYPVYTSDSASATIGGANGILMDFSGGVQQWVHWTDYVRRTWDCSIADGLSDDTEAPRLGRWALSMRSIDEMARQATELWRLQGVSWED